MSEKTAQNPATAPTKDQIAAQTTGSQTAQPQQATPSPQQTPVAPAPAVAPATKS